jgi:outer membrane protein assembly factor BamB
VRRLALAAGVLILIGAAALGIYVFQKKRAERDVHGSPTVEFVTTQEPPEPPKPKEAGVVWPTYGYSNDRRRIAPGDHRPPYRVLWRFGARKLVEFPPVLAYGRLYFANNGGVLYAVGAANGGRAWRFRSRRCVAASPAVSGKLVFQTFMNRPPCNASGGQGLDGEIAAFYAGSGKIRWRRTIGPSESSPLVANGHVVVGDWRGKVYSLNANTGRLNWTFSTGGKVKGAAALAGGRIVVGSYDHHVYALDERTGRLVWKASAQDRLGPRGTFYSTPAVAYGRVYIGSTDGKVYSFGASSGKLRWSHDTGNYVYSSPAVWRRKVLVGSYSGDFLALDAATGDEVWRFHANGPISGSATVLDGVVYFATLKERTYALDARTGKQLWAFPDGKYSPLVADDERVYLVGFARVYGMRER